MSRMKNSLRKTTLVDQSVDKIWIFWLQRQQRVVVAAEQLTSLDLSRLLTALPGLPIQRYQQDIPIICFVHILDFFCLIQSIPEHFSGTTCRISHLWIDTHMVIRLGEEAGVEGGGLLREKCHHRHYHVMYYIQSSFMVQLRTIYRSSHRSGPSQKDCPRKREADCTLFKMYQCPRLNAHPASYF